MEEIVELRQYLFIIRKWLWLIVLCTLLAGGTAYGVNRWMIFPTYRASTTLLITQSSNPTSNYQDILFSQRIAQTYAELLQKRPVVEETLNHLGYTHIDPDEPLFELKVQPVRDTQLIELQVESTLPQLAKEIADTLPQVFIQQYEGMQTSRFASSKENLAKHLAELERSIEQTEKSLAELEESDSPEEEAKRAQLESTLNQYRSSYSNLLQSYEEIRLAEAQSTDNVVVTEPAQMPKEPVWPRVKLNTLLAAVVGSMLAVGTAFLIEYLDDTIKSPDEISEVLGLSSLAAIPLIPGGEIEDKLIASGHSRSPISEAYRVLRTNIQFSSPDRTLKTLLISSPGPTEGKSLTLANLGVVMAQAGQRVILVDCDLRRPTLHRIFGLSNESGLTSALFNDDSDVDRWLQPTEVDNLSVLTSGPLPPNPSELLGSQRMEEMVKELKARADVILFDSPPSLAVTDAAVLANQVDGTILVIDAGTTRREPAQRAKYDLDNVGGNILGATLNRVSTDSRGGYYYYYYYYSEDGTRRRRRRKRGNWIGRLIERIPLVGRGKASD
ncbi:MAG: polysaccharide biosynthesis tyrosine autokinase [Chloroflexota bacterium]|nr:polysaccharide biosynthesis tyrosine autokinase [Chloroflexota bacterium]